MRGRFKQVAIGAILLGLGNFSLTASPESLQLNPQTLSESQPARSARLAGFDVRFHKDGTYVLNCVTQNGFWTDAGKFSVQNDRVILTAPTCEPSRAGETSRDCERTFGNVNCIHKHDPRTLYFADSLLCSFPARKGLTLDFFSMVFPQTQIRPGQSSMYRGIPVVSMGNVRGKTRLPAMLRRTPSVRSTNVPFQPGKPAPSRSIVPANTELQIIARTERKERLNKTDSFWYLVSVGLNTELWMFGEAISLE